jgi:hypothetical protein
MWGYPPSNAMERAQERTEEMLRREDEQVAMSRFAEHESKDEETNDSARS